MFINQLLQTRKQHGQHQERWNQGQISADDQCDAAMVNAGSLPRCLLRYLLVPEQYQRESYLSTLSISDTQARFYSFTPEVLNQCVQTTLQQHGAKSNDTAAIITTLLEQLTAAYPDAGFQVDFRDTSEWVFNNAAGAMGSMYIIHASITE
jgi:hypothetical protein